MNPAPIRTHTASEFPLELLVDTKGSTTVSVCIPARNEEPTVGAIVSTIRAALVDTLGLVDEIIVIDDHSSDRTAELATDAGARVVRAAEVLPEFGQGHGKGEALWKSLYASTGDIVIWCDADVRDFDTRFITGMAKARFEPAAGEATLSGVYAETDDRTGLASMVAPLRIGGRLSPALVSAWEG